MLQKPLGPVASGHPDVCDPRDLAREAAGAAADVEDLEPGRDPGGFDQKRHPEPEVVLSEAGVEMLSRKPFRAKGDRVEAQ